MEPRSPKLHADSLPSESPGKPKNIGMSSLFLLQGNFPTHELNRGLLYCRWILYQLSHQGSPRILEWVAYLFSSGSSDPGIELGSPALQADSLPAEPPGKPKNTRVGRLSFLQRTFQSQESNGLLPHCRQILYQLSHQGSPRILEWVAYPFSSRSSRPRN